MDTTLEIPLWEQEVLTVFVTLFETFGLPRSTALLYGTLYCAETPMLQEELSQRLQISSGSASQGLKLLQSIGAVHREIPIGQRHSHYTAERSLRRLIGHLLDAQLRPKLQTSKQRLQSLSENLPEENEHARQRIQTLLSWQKKVDQTLPLLSTLFQAPTR